MRLRLAACKLAFSALAVASALAASPAYAACTGPAGNTGDIIYSSTSGGMYYCNGASWISMGVSSSYSFGTMTTGAFCTATSATSIACSTTGINLASQVTGILPPANGGTGVNNGSYTLTLANNFATSGAFPVTLTATGTTNVTLPTSGILTTGSGTANYLSKWTSTNAMGSSVLYDGGTNIGIGTTAPAVSLDLSARTDALALPLGNTANRPTGVNGMIRYNSSTPGIEAYVNGGWQSLMSSNGSGTSLGTGTANYVARWISATTLGTGLLYDNGTNVGIGTASPTANLTVNGTTAFLFGADYTTTGSQSAVALGSASSVRYAGSAVATFYGVAAGVDGQIIHLHNASNYTLTLANQSTSDTTAANRIITGSGADLKLLAGASAILQYDATSARWRVIGGSGGTPAGTTGQVQFNTAGAFNADSTFTWDNTNKLLTVGTGADTPSATTGTVASYVMKIIPQAVSPSVSTSSTGVTSNAAAAGQMAYYSGTNAISGTPNLYVSGSNIGIGTSTATNNLSFSGASAQTIWMERNPTASTAGNNLTIQAGGAASGGTNLVGGNLILASGIATGTGTSQIQFKVYPAGSSGTTNGTATTAMTITGAGSVGIGTTVPGFVLDVQGTSGALGDFYLTSGTNAYVYLRDTVRSYALYSNNGTFGVFDNTAGLSRLSIGSSGNVGIGTTTPSSSLHVNTASAINGAIASFTMPANAGNWGYVNLTQGTLRTTWGIDPNGDAHLFAATGQGVSLWAGGIPSMRILSNGYVGIGTTSPSGLLHIAGTGGGSAHVGLIIQNTTSSTGKTWRLTNVDSDGTFRVTQPNIVDAITVMPTSGYVGIGTTSPSYILDVTGQARFTGGYTTSDRRWKTNIEPVSGGLDLISHLQGVKYDWRRSEFPDMHFAEGRQIGFIAQEVEKVLPEIVSTDAKGYKNLSYESVVPVLVEAVKELKADNAAQRALIVKQGQDFERYRQDFEQYKKEHP